MSSSDAEPPNKPSSAPYVIAEYDEEVRKIRGDWMNDSYSNLIEAIRSKFDIEHQTQIDIKVYDRNTNKYFSIGVGDMHMVELIPSDGLIKITTSQNKEEKHEDALENEQKQPAPIPQDKSEWPAISRANAKKQFESMPENDWIEWVCHIDSNDWKIHTFKKENRPFSRNLRTNVSYFNEFGPTIIVELLGLQRKRKKRRFSDYNELFSVLLEHFGKLNGSKDVKIINSYPHNVARGGTLKVWVGPFKNKQQSLYAVQYSLGFTDFYGYQMLCYDLLTKVQNEIQTNSIPKYYNVKNC